MVLWHIMVYLAKGMYAACADTRGVPPKFRNRASEIIVTFTSCASWWFGYLLPFAQTT